MAQKQYDFRIGDLAYIKKHTGISPSILLEMGMDIASVDQCCIILARDSTSIIIYNYCYVYLQHDQTRGWVHKYDLEKLDG